MITSSNGNISRVTGPLWRESTGHRWIPLTKARDAVLWCFLWSAFDHYDVIVMMIYSQIWYSFIHQIRMFTHKQPNVIYADIVDIFLHTTISYPKWHERQPQNKRYRLLSLYNMPLYFFRYPINDTQTCAMIRNICRFIFVASISKSTLPVIIWFM